MKTFSITLFVLFTVILVSCKKDNTIIDLPSDFGFKAFSTDYNWKFEPDSPRLERGARFIKTISANTNNPTYVLEGWSTSEGIRVQYYLNSPTLAVSTYRNVTTLNDKYVGSIFYINNNLFGTVTDDYISVTITNISGNYASGYFGAVMHDVLSQTKEIRVFNGYFNNILIQN